MNTKISYLYRDADNYKKVNECVFAGALTAEQICAIKDCCDMGEYFIPSQVGLPERRFDRYDPAPTVALTAAELVNRFEECRNNWQDEAYTPQMGGMV